MKPIGCLAVLLFVCRAALAQSCCECCGCQASCQKVCRVVCEIKKVPKNVYDCECEDFCVPGPSEHCVEYDACGCKHHVFTPTCGCVRTRVKLVKTEEVTEKKVYKCVVQNMCCQCAQNSSAEAASLAGKDQPRPSGNVLPAGYAAESAAARATLAVEPAEAAKSKFGLGRLLEPLARKR
jgi:hypothetical protein